MDVFNFEVDGLHNYHVGNVGVLVHNESSVTIPREGRDRSNPPKFLLPLDDAPDTIRTDALPRVVRWEDLGDRLGRGLAKDVRTLLTHDLRYAVGLPIVPLNNYQPLERLPAERVMVEHRFPGRVVTREVWRERYEMATGARDLSQLGAIRLQADELDQYGILRRLSAGETTIPTLGVHGTVLVTDVPGIGMRKGNYLSFPGMRVERRFEKSGWVNVGDTRAMLFDRIHQARSTQEIGLKIAHDEPVNLSRDAQWLTKEDRAPIRDTWAVLRETGVAVWDLQGLKGQMWNRISRQFEPAPLVFNDPMGVSFPHSPQPWHDIAVSRNFRLLDALYKIADR